MHRLLRRQLRKAFGHGRLETPELEHLGRLVGEAYKQFDDHLDMLDRSIELSSKELMQRNAEMRAVFQSFPDTFLWVDREGTIHDVKGGMSDVVNLMPREFVGRKIWDIPIACGQEKCASVFKALEDATDILQTEYSVDLDGQSLHYEARLLNLPGDLVLIILRNITDIVVDKRKRELAEQQLRDIIEFLPDATFVVDRDKRVIAWNKATEKMTGVPKEEVLGKGNQEYAVPFYGFRRPVLLDLLDMDNDELKRKYDFVQRVGDTLVTEVYMPTLGKGAYLWAIATLLRDSQGRVTGAIESVRDITDRKLQELENAVLYRVSNAAGTCESIREFLATIHTILLTFIRAENFFVALADEHRDAVVFPYYSDRKDSLLEMGRISERKVPTPTILVLRSGLLLHLTGEELRARIEDGELDLVGSLPTDWLGVPLISRKRILGVMAVQHYAEGNRFSETEERLLTAVAGQVARALERRYAEKALKESEAKFRSMFESAAWGIFQTTPQGEMLSVNPALAKIFGYDSPEEMIGRVVSKDLYKDPVQRQRMLDQLERQDLVTHMEMTGIRRDGTLMQGEVTVQAVRDENGQLVRLDGALEDVTGKRLAEAALEEQKAYFRQLFDNSPLAIMLLDAEGAIKDVNQAFERLFGFTKEEMNTLEQNVVPERFQEESEEFFRACRRGESVTEETIRRTRSGREINVSLISYPFIHQGEVAGAFIIYRDISVQKAYETQLTHQALHDDLTGLPNRALFMERLRMSMGRCRREERYEFAVLLVDLDEFKRINDSMGHVTGDRMLIEVARRLKDSIRNTDTVARLGGDEFGIILEDFRSPGEAIRSVRRMHGKLRQPYWVGTAEIVITASTGIVLKTHRYASAEDILRDADLSMYRAKELGRNRFKVFDQGLHRLVLDAVRVESELRRAIPAGELFLVYQPIYDVASGRLKGFEALTRWDHPDLGIIGPNDFIPVAEDTGLIVDLGVWVLQTACRQLRQWTSEVGAMKPSVSINISAKHFSQHDLVRTFRNTLEGQDIPRGKLNIEITETAIMENPHAALRKLQALKKMGLRISLDDFGTGYSSLAYLQRLPVDVLKLDRHFIRQMGRDTQSMDIVRAVIMLGHSLGLSVVAEGVETQEQYSWIRAMDCDLAQGFLFNRPLEVAHASQLVTGE